MGKGDVTLCGTSLGAVLGVMDQTAVPPIRRSGRDRDFAVRIGLRDREGPIIRFFSLRLVRVDQTAQHPERQVGPLPLEPRFGNQRAPQGGYNSAETPVSR